MRAVSVKISTIAHATEDLANVLQAISNLCPVDFPRKVETRKLRGHYGNEITVCQLTVKGRFKAEQFLNNLWGKLSTLDQTSIHDEISTRLDETGNLHLRIDKQAALTGRFSLQESDPIKVEISFRLEARQGKRVSEMVRLKLLALG